MLQQIIVNREKKREIYGQNDCWKLRRQQALAMVAIS